MINQARNITLCGQHLSNVRHVCGFFDSREQQFETMMPFFQEGLDDGEQAITIFESEKHPQVYRAMQSAGIPIEQAERSGQLKVLASEDTYIQNGVFAADRMYKVVEDFLIDAGQGSYPGVRACGDMVWALRNVSGTDELMIYEARLNFLVPQYPVTLLCMYDINRFSGKAVADILATHSHVILNGRIYENQHYVEPLTFLQELIHRKKRPLGREDSLSDSFYGHDHGHVHAPAISEAMAEAMG